jgi:hypothetical protein
MSEMCQKTSMKPSTQATTTRFSGLITDAVFNFRTPYFAKRTKPRKNCKKSPDSTLTMGWGLGFKFKISA